MEVGDKVKILSIREPGLKYLEGKTGQITNILTDYAPEFPYIVKIDGKSYGIACREEEIERV
jgi:hypothetical protein